jgi:hypothetical protein
MIRNQATQDRLFRPPPLVSDPVPSGRKRANHDRRAPRLGKCRTKRTQVNVRRSKAIEEETFSRARGDRAISSIPRACVSAPTPTRSSTASVSRGSACCWSRNAFALTVRTTVTLSGIPERRFHRRSTSIENSRRFHHTQLSRSIKIYRLPRLLPRSSTHGLARCTGYSRIPSSLLNSSSASIIVSISGTIGASVAAASARTDSFVNGDMRIVRITS